MEIILVRHTRPDVPPGTCYGWTDIDVASSFQTEAKETLKNLQQYLPVDKAFTSPLQRASKLASFCGFEDAQPDARLKEMNMGEWEMQEYLKINDPAIHEWYKDYLNLPATGGESFRVLYKRVSEFLDELKTTPYKRVVLFAHAGPIVSAAMYAGVCSDANAFDYAPSYGDIIKINI